jgi:hypothetical protein
MINQSVVVKAKSRREKQILRLLENPEKSITEIEAKEGPIGEIYESWLRTTGNLKMMQMREKEIYARRAVRRLVG